LERFSRWLCTLVLLALVGDMKAGTGLFRRLEREPVEERREPFVSGVGGWDVTSSLDSVNLLLLALVGDM